MPIPNKVIVSRESDEQVLHLTLNAPKGNVIDKQMIMELADAINRHATMPEIKALIFEGAGEHFSFGASVPEHRREFVAEMLHSFHGFFKALITAAKPMLAVVRGQCLGGGLELAAFCHWIFASEEAFFGQPEIKLGVYAPVASLILPSKIGQAAADDLLLTGRSIPAREAEQLGLVKSISENPSDDARAFISKHILPKSAVALRFAVQSSRQEMYRAFLQNIDAVEKRYLEELMATEDANEGIQAFLEKREAVWKNR